MTAPQDDILDLLTAYALDALEPEEITRLHRLLDEQPELRATLAELHITANQLPYGLPEAEPPPELRQRVLDYATGRAERAPAEAARLPGRLRGWLFGLGGLAAVAVVAAAIGWGQVAGLQRDLTQTRMELVSARENLATAQAVIARLEGDSGQGAMVRTTAGGTVFVVKLPQLQAGRIYQLWRIQGKNKPADAGLFSIDQQGYGVFDLASGQQLQAGDTMAVTDEPDGGSPQPTTSPLIVGQVQT
jgi:anti-sigma-K factor RskA